MNYKLKYANNVTNEVKKTTVFEIFNLAHVLHQSVLQNAASPLSCS